MRMKKTVDLDSVEIVAAETVITRCLKIVDDRGNVRIDATVSNGRADNEGPRIRLLARDGYASVVLSVVDGIEGEPDVVQLWMAGEDDQSISLWLGGMRGPGLDLQGPRRRGKDGARLELLAEHRAVFTAVHGEGTKRTIMQLSLGEEPETSVRGAVDESEEIAR